VEGKISVDPLDSLLHFQRRSGSCKIFEKVRQFSHCGLYEKGFGVGVDECHDLLPGMTFLLGDRLNHQGLPGDGFVIYKEN
jgi:hypothetical protein